MSTPQPSASIPAPGPSPAESRRDPNPLVPAAVLEILAVENAELRARLEEAEQTLEAIRTGEVDALVIEGPSGQQIFTLQGLDAEASRARGEMLGQVSDAVIAVDDLQNVTYLNEAAAELYGVDISHTLGRHLSDLYTARWYDPADADIVAAVLTTHGRARVELVHVTGSGTSIDVEVSVTRLPMESGPSGTSAVMVTRNITTRKQLEQQRRVLLEAESAGRAQAERREHHAKILADASSTLSGPEPLPERLQRVAEGLIPSLGDLVLIEGLRNDGRVEILALADRDPDRANSLLAGRQAALSLWLGPRARRDGAVPETVSALGTVHIPLTTVLAEVTGVLIIGRDRPGSLDEDERRLAAELGRQVALVLESARMYDEQRRIARTLQFALLSGECPMPPGVTAVVRYHAAQPGMEIGGDWYDVFELGEDLVGLAVGDVVGRGLVAAAAMGRLRSALRAIALGTDDPGEVLSRLDRFARFDDDAFCATVAYAVLDARHGTLRYAAAGHPEPLVTDPDGHITFLEGGRSAPLAVTPATRPTATTTLGRGSTLIMYSDGLIERRTEDLDVGRERLREAVGSARGQDLERMADTIVERCLDGAFGTDDVALLGVRLEPRGARVFTRRLAARPGALGPLRQALRGWLTEAALTPEEIDDVLIALGEACNNAIEHAYDTTGIGDMALEVRVEPGELRATVRDFGHWRRPAMAGERGRGTMMMRTVMDEVTISARAMGTAVHLKKFRR